MLFPRELRADQRRPWLEAICTDTVKRARITVTNRSGDVVGSTQVHLLSMQTTIDTSAETVRRLDVTCVDVNGLLERSSSLLWHVEMLHQVPALGRFVSSPVGVYVPNQAVRKGREVTALLPDLTAQWAVNLPRNQFGAIGKGVPVTAAARELLTNMGQRRFRWYTAKERDGKNGMRLVRTTQRYQYGGPDEADRPIPMLTRMLASYGVDFFFDGDGCAVARPVRDRPLYDLDDLSPSDSVDSVVLAQYPVEETTKWGNAYNRVVVRSGDGKKAMTSRPAEAPDWHPASAKKRAVNGVPIHHTLFLTSESRVQARLNERARDALNAQLADHRTVTARCLPLPFDPLDRIRVRGESGPVTSALRQASIDWVGGEGMEVGASRRLGSTRPGKRGKR